MHHTSGSKSNSVFEIQLKDCTSSRYMHFKTVHPGLYPWVPLLHSNTNRLENSALIGYTFLKIYNI